MIQLDIDGYHAGDVRRRVFGRHVLSGDIEFPGVVDTEVVSARRLLVFIGDDHDVAEVRREVVRRLKQIIQKDASEPHDVTLYSLSALVLEC